MNYSTLAADPHGQAGSANKLNWSKKVTKRRRRSAAKDRRALGLTRVSSFPGISAAEETLVANPTQPPTNDNCPSNNKIDNRREKRRRTHGWDHTTDTGKVTTANRVLEAGGNGYAFTLNLSPDEIAAANDNAKGFVDYFKRRIDRALKRAVWYAPDYWFAVDVDRGGRLHIQGTIEANDNDADLIEGALDGAVEWSNPKGKQFKCFFERLVTPDVWANYCLRNQANVRRMIKGKPVSIANPLRRRAKAIWPEA